MLLGAFCLTGATSLIFEVVWTRLLLLSLGTTPVAMGVVLGAFMGGMAAGAWLAGRACIRRLAPVAVYAGIEVWIGLYALATPVALRLVDLAPPAVQLVLGVFILLPATVGMGMSLPVLVRVLDARSMSRATSVGWLYSANTAGGVAGPLLTVFLLFPLAGVSRTLVIAAAVNFLVAGAVWLGRSCWPTVASIPSGRPAAAAAGATTAKRVTATASPVPRVLYVILAVSGATAMVYEVAWSRTLSMVYGSSVYGVSIMLSTFLVGIALGSWLAAARVRRSPATLLGAVWLLAGSAWAAFVSLHVGGRLPFLFLDLYRWVGGGTTELYGVQFLLAAFLMLPATVCLGALLPIVVSLAHASSREHARPMVSSLYAANLVGSATGALLASGLLLASVGLNVSVQAGVLVALGVALVTTVRLPGPHPRTIGATVLAVLLVLALDGGARRLALSFGLYHGAPSYADNDDRGIRDLLASHELLFYRDGPTASVAVQQADRYVLMKINGKTDASTGAGDIETQTLLGHLPLMAAARADRVAVIGFGSGMTAGAVLTHPVREVDAFEIEPAVVEASRYFEPINGRPLDDERLRLVIGDARGELRRDIEPYDVIISEPSNPWITGVANLFTRDFFELASSRLAPGGVVAQWFHLYGMSEASAREVMATFRSVYPHVVAFKDRDLILLGSHSPITFSLEQMTRRFADPGIRESLAEAYVRYPADLLVKLRLDERGTAAFAAGAMLNTDDNMRLELAAPRTLYQDRFGGIQTELDRHRPAPLDLLTDYESPAAAEFELAASFFTAGRDDAALRHCERALALESSFEALKLLGQIAERGGDRRRARNAWRLALATGGDPGQRALVQALLGAVEPA
jgi:spermidine synthase